jgi:hypothetical protein
MRDRTITFLFYPGRFFLGNWLAIVSVMDGEDI